MVWEMIYILYSDWASDIILFFGEVYRIITHTYFSPFRIFLGFVYASPFQVSRFPYGVEWWGNSQSV